MRSIAYRIRGLDCAEEISALRDTVGRLDGVQQLDFDLLKGVMKVTCADERPGDQSIRAAVKAAGLEALSADAACPSGVCGVEEGFWRRKGRVILCAASGVLVGAGFAVHALLCGSLLEALSGGEHGACAFPLPAMLLYAAATIAGAWYILPKAAAAARRLRPDMNLLMTVAAIGAIAIGQWFEAATVTFLFALALLLESWSVGHARRAIESLLELAPDTAHVVGPRDGDTEERPASEVKVGATVVVRPGERIPLDGVVTEGSTTVNQAPITGESAPVEKAPGSEVFAGTINHDGAIRFRVAKPASDSTLARIIRMVEEAQSRRARAEQWVEVFARYYTPAMMAVALLVAILPPLFGGAPGAWFYRGLVMLVIACPCALVISTPVSMVAGLASAARAGVLVKGGAYLEIPARLRAVAFDKTGTLTHGHPEVQAVVPLDGHTAAQLLATAAGMETMSEHPLGRAIRRRAESEGVAPRPAADFQSLPGKGARAVIDGKRYWIGSHRLVHELGLETEFVHARAEAMEDAGHTVVVVGNDLHICGLISIADSLRPNADAAVRGLKAAAVLHVAMLTGDNDGTARRIAGATGVDEVRAELLPEDKIRAIESLVARFGDVAMVGDGVNDAPAMAAATVGIAMGAAGTDAAIETADIALMSDDLTRLPWLIRHSRRVLGVVKQNVAFALGTKLVFMALAVAGAATLWMAIAADMGASLLVIFNGLRLLRASEWRPFEAGAAAGAAASP